VTKDLFTFFSGNEDKFGNKIDHDSSLIPDLAPKDTFWFIPVTHWESNNSDYLVLPRKLSNN